MCLKLFSYFFGLVEVRRNLKLDVIEGIVIFFISILIDRNLWGKVGKVMRLL